MNSESTAQAIDLSDSLLVDAKDLSAVLKKHLIGDQDIGKALSAVKNCNPMTLKIAALLVLDQFGSDPNQAAHRKFLNAILGGTLPSANIGWHQFQV